MTLPILSAADDGFCHKQAREPTLFSRLLRALEPFALICLLPLPATALPQLFFAIKERRILKGAQRSFLASTTAAVEHGLIHHVVAFRRSSCLGRLRMRTLCIRSNRFEVPHS